MAFTAKLYGQGWLMRQLEDWLTSTFKVMLTTSGYTPDQDAHDYRNDVTNEVTGSGYTAGGATLTGKTATYTAATNKIMLDANDVSWGPNASITFRHAVIYKDTGTASTSPLVAYQQGDSDVSVTNGTLTLQWNAAGIVEVTVA